MQEWQAERQHYARLLRRRLSRLERRRGKILADLAKAQEGEGLRRRGELLRVHQAKVPPGLTQVTLPDYYAGSGATLTIPLDPTISVEANALRYFKQARKAKRGLPIMERRLAETEKELHQWEGALREVEQADTPGALEAATSAHGLVHLARPPARPRRRGDEAAARLEPRRFLSSDGREILVGRSAAGNEHLTFHLARPHDLWLHVEGYGGSHVVIRNPKGQTVPPVTLREAAQIAAYFSKARNARKVPVHYTAVRFVRRSKGGKSGTVLITQEKAIIVPPDPTLLKRLTPPNH
jgi:predicted ribosome quality control (RQC) complex YloA/Tae2 family protein